MFLENALYRVSLDEKREVHVQAHEQVKFNAHRNPAAGRRACVLVNLDVQPHEATVRFDPTSTMKARLYQPFPETAHISLPATITLPPQQLAVLVED